MTTASHRKSIPVGVKLHACLLLLGFTDEEIANGIQWDHEPALGLRHVDPCSGEMLPAANDPHFIRPMRTADHLAKTTGRRGERTVTSAGSDIHAIAKVRRLTKAQEAARRRMLAKQTGEPAPPPQRKTRWPKRGLSAAKKIARRGRQKNPMKES